MYADDRRPALVLTAGFGCGEPDHEVGGGSHCRTTVIPRRFPHAKCDRNRTVIAGDHRGGQSSRTAGDGRRERGQGRPRLRRLGLAACLVTVGAGAATLVAHGSTSSVAPAKEVPLGTATVQLRDLIETERYGGRLSYPSRGIVHLSGAGTVTSLPRVGQIVTQGASVAGVDDQPIGVLLGATPLYRMLASVSTTSRQLAVLVAQAGLLTAQANLSQATQSSGSDRGGSSTGAEGSATRVARVAQAQVGVDQARDQLLGAQRALERVQTPQRGPDVALVAGAMTALGYYRGVTDSWNAALQDAVREWQDSIGAAPSGQIGPDHVLVVGGASRVSGVHGAVGDPPSGVTISLTSLSRVATFRVVNGVPAALARGRRVTLSAGRDSAAGRIRSVTTSHQSAIVQVAFDQSSRLARTGATRVTMSVTTADRRNVLTVPTQALLALAPGGYGLQLPDGRLLAVRTGVVQGGEIEVSGRSLRGGLRVVSVT
jgi:hypothetical protein